MKKWMLVTFLVVLFFACKKDNDDSGIIPNNDSIISNNEFEAFIGLYEVQSRHISGIETFYDSIGNQIGMGIDTSFVDNELLTISQYNQTDTLLLEGLINSFFQNHRTAVKCVYSNDSLHIVHEFSVEILRNNYIRGKIWMKDDSLFLDYHWDKSDLWSSGALPEYGEVLSSGVRVD